MGQDSDHPPDRPPPREAQSTLLPSGASSLFEDTEGASLDSAPTVGRHHLIEELGRGGMGVVYRAYDPKLRREVALKMISAGLSGHPDLRRRFLREARACAQLRHPNIIEVLDVATEGDAVWFTMPLLSGPTLARRVSEEGPLPPAEVARIGAALCEALAHSHAAGLLHRDVKPGNVLFDGERPVLMDFGLVKQTGEESAELTRDTAIMGTAAYMAPELLEMGAAWSSPASDQYGLAATLYRGLAGQRPYPGDNPMELIHNMLSGPPKRLESLGVPKGLARVIHRGLAWDPNDRFPDMKAFREALLAWEDASSLSLIGQDVRMRTRDRLRRSRGALIGALVVAALASAVPATRAVQRQQAAARAEERRVEMQAAVTPLLEQGQLAEAERRFMAFAGLEENQDQRALVRAWSDWGEAMMAQGQDDAAMDALTTSYVLAEGREDRARSLSALARLCTEQRRWDALEAIVGQLEELGAEVAPASRVALLAARAELVAAASLSEGPLRGVLSALAKATPLSRVGVDAKVLPGTPDRLALLEPEAGELQLLELSLEPTLLGRAAVSTTHKVRDRLRVLAPTGSEQAELLLWQDGRCVVARWVGAELERGPSVACDLPMDAARADLDGDGVGEIYLSDRRRLLRLLPDGEGGLLEQSAHRSTSYSNSIAHALTPVRWRGGPALAVGLGRWGAYDLRVLVHGDDALRLVARDTLGVAAAVTALRHQGQTALAVMQHHDPEEPLDKGIFSPGGLRPRARGVHVYTLGDEGLTWRGALPPPPPYAEPPLERRGVGYHAYALLAGDLDGDGEDELIFSQGFGDLQVYAWDAEVGWVGVTLDGLAPLLAHDVDGDGDAELLVRDVRAGDQLWWLGAGGASPPSARTRPRRARQPPEPLTGSDRDRWSRAERLIAIGLEAEGRARLSDLARQRTGTPTEALAWMRVGELLEADDALEEAAEAYEQAARDPEQAPRALLAAARCLQTRLRFDRAVDALAAHPSLPSDLAQELRRLQELLNGPSQTADFRAGVPEGWAVGEPLALRAEPGLEGLRMRLAHGQEALRVPLRRTEPSVRLTLDLDPKQIDWSMGVYVWLSSEAGEGSLRWQALGGGRIVELGPACGEAESSYAFHLMAPEEVRSRGPWRVVYEHLDGQEWASCTLYEGEEERARNGVRPIPLPPVGEAVTLSLRGAAYAPFNAEAVLRSLSFKGLKPSPLELSPLELAHAALVRGRAQEAASLLGAAGGPDAAITRALIAEDLGDPKGAVAALAEGLAVDPRLGGELHSLLLTHPARLRRPLLEVLGADYYVAVAEAYDGPLNWPGAVDDQSFVELMEGLEDHASCCMPAAPAAKLYLHRAAALRRLGRTAPALIDLERALALDMPDAEQDALEASLHAERASALVALGRSDEAMAALRLALDTHPSPEAFADRLAQRPELQPLREHPGWAALEDRRRGLEAEEAER